MKSKKEQKTKRQPKDKKITTPAPTIKAEKPEAEPKHTIKQVVIEAIAANNAVTNEEMITSVLAEFPKSAFKDSHAAWYARRRARDC